MTRRRRHLTVPVGIAALAATASCGGGSSDDAASTTTPVPLTFVATTTTSVATTAPTADEGIGALGILTLRPVISCEPRARADEALDQDLLPMIDGERDCVVSPSAGTGAVFERGSAVAVRNDQIDQWVVNVDLRPDGEEVWNAVAVACFVRDATCPTGQLAIVLDGVIQSAPLVQTPDFPGAVQISGGFDEQQARGLAEVLNRVVEPIDDGDAAEPTPTTVAPTTAPPPPAAVETTEPGLVEEAPVVEWDGVYRQKTTPGITVQLGDISPVVEQLQQALSRAGYTLEADGYFGYGTESVVRQFQRDRGLPVNGIATDDVWDALGR